jgi:hypothetical protein
MDRRLGGPQNLYGRGGEEKNSQLIPRIELPVSKNRKVILSSEIERPGEGAVMAYL